MAHNSFTGQLQLKEDIMGRKRWVLGILSKRTCVCILFILILGFPMLRGDQYPYGFPTANLDVESKVPLEILRELALDDAQKTWGNVILGSEIPCSDVDGNINAYMFVFRIIRDFESMESIKHFESYQEIQEGIRQGQRRYEVVMEEMATLAVDAEMPEMQRKLYEARMQRWGADKYGTIIFSATNNQTPVLEKIHGLPYYYSRLDVTYQKVQEALGWEPELYRICFITPMAIFYEFTIGEKRIWVNSFSDEVFEVEPQIYERVRLRSPLSQDAREENRKRWEERKRTVNKRRE